MTQPTEGWHRRAFRGLLLLYPRWFREAHGEEMTLLFSARLERAGGSWGRIRLWWRTIVDAGATSWPLRRRDKQGGILLTRFFRTFVTPHADCSDLPQRYLRLGFSSGPASG